jgi:sulfite reductase (NADPH) hemoprotein beta-component
MRALTANRLADGEVVFWSHGRWVERFAEAQLFDDHEAEAAEAVEGHAKTEVTIVVEPYLIDLVPADDSWAPLSFRERLRALGPSNRPDHGKQASGDAAVETLMHASGAARSTGRVNLIKRK